jgi:quaternary ammonium compound-resistance protein SugE
MLINNKETQLMPWLFLILAAICEMSWPLGFKLTSGFRTNIWITIATILVMLLSFYFLSQATIRGIPIGTAYAVWTGLGAVGTAIIGITLFQESRDLIRLLCLTLIIVGVVGLKFSTPAPT